MPTAPPANGAAPMMVPCGLSSGDSTSDPTFAPLTLPPDATGEKEGKAALFLERAALALSNRTTGPPSAPLNPLPAEAPVGDPSLTKKRPVHVKYLRIIDATSERTHFRSWLEGRGQRRSEHARTHAQNSGRYGIGQHTLNYETTCHHRPTETYLPTQDQGHLEEEESTTETQCRVLWTKRTRCYYWWQRLRRCRDPSLYFHEYCSARLQMSC